MVATNTGLCVLAACLVLGARPARSEPPTDRARAEALFAAAKAHMESGDLLAACNEFSESESLDPQVGTALNLAYCYERTGRTATAWSTWLKAAAAASAKGQHERQDVAIARATSLQSRLLHATVTVRPQPAREQIRVTIDRAPLPKTEWGLPIALDPGQHEIVAVVDGFRPWSHDFMVTEGAEPTLVVPELQRSTPPLDASRAPARSAPAGVLWGSGAAAGVLLGAGAGFGIASLVNRGASNTPDGRCGSAGCDETGHAERVRANTDAVAADILFGSAGVAVVAGAIAYLVLRRDAKVAMRSLGALGGAGAGGSWSAFAGPLPDRGAGMFVTGRW